MPLKHPNPLLSKTRGFLTRLVFPVLFFLATACLAANTPEPFFDLAAAYRNEGAPVLSALWFRAYLDAAGGAPGNQASG